MQWILEERESVCDKGGALNKSTTLHWISPHPVAGVWEFVVIRNWRKWLKKRKIHGRKRRRR